MSRRSRSVTLEKLEFRRLLCLDHEMFNNGVEPVEELAGFSPFAADGTPKFGPALNTGPEVNEPANIVWTNRGTGSALGGDRFGNVFGANADAARAVIDQVIVAFERLVGSFNYPTAGATYSLSLTMGTTQSLGAGASMSSTLGGKPKSGAVTMGGSSAWWLDPTPADSSEFQGNIVNAFSGDAQGGSPAAGRSDFFTVASAELTHCLGLYGGLGMVPAWDALTTNTGVPDNAEGGGIGTFWVFRGPSIKHLLTGNNGGGGGNSFNGGVHAAGPTGGGTLFEGFQYNGAEDIGNAVYERSVRYLPNETFALMFKDAFGYSSTSSAASGSMYANLNRTTGALLVRGGASNSADTIVVSRAGSKLVVSVDVGNDVVGTGALSGPGNLPAWVSEFDLSEISSITINAGDQNDVIRIDSLDDATPVTITGGSGNDTVIVGDQDGPVESNVTVNLDAGDDTLTVLNTTGPATVIANSTAGVDVINVNTDNTGSASVSFNSTQLTISALNIGDGGVATMSPNGSRVLRINSSLSIAPSGKLDLNDNDLIVDYPAAGASPILTISALIGTARAGGTWSGFGITSSLADAAVFGLGVAESSQVVGGSGGGFSGVVVDGSAVLVKYTYNGDANLSGAVEVDDLGLLATAWQTPGGWFAGDSDYSGFIDTTDLGLLASNWQAGVGAPLRPTSTTSTRLATTLRRRMPQSLDLLM